jgi:hypothetical protein
MMVEFENVYDKTDTLKKILTIFITKMLPQNYTTLLSVVKYNMTFCTKDKHHKSEVMLTHFCSQ